jgi:hypothetical protein
MLSTYRNSQILPTLLPYSVNQIFLWNIWRSLRMADCQDVLILPGSKNTLSDLQILRERGWEDWIRQYLGKFPAGGNLWWFPDAGRVDY